MDFSALVQDLAWVPINIVLLVASALLLPGITGLFSNLEETASATSVLALIATQLGIAWYVCIQFLRDGALAADRPAIARAV